MKQVQEEHLCRDIHKIALALEKIAKALPSAKQEAHDIRFADKDHVWINNEQYISITRVGQMVRKWAERHEDDLK